MKPLKKTETPIGLTIKNQVKNLPIKNVNAPSTSSIAEMHILYRYTTFDEICSGVEVCRPHPR